MAKFRFGVGPFRKHPDQHYIREQQAPIPIEWYEIQRCDSDLKGRSWWNTIHSVKTKKKALEIAKKYEKDGRRIRIWQKGQDIMKPFTGEIETGEPTTNYRPVIKRRPAPKP